MVLLLPYIIYSEVGLQTDVVLLKQSGQKWFWLQWNVVMWTICGFNAAALGARETSLSETVGNRLWQDLVPSVSQHCQGLKNVDRIVLPWDASIKMCNQLHEVCISVVYLNILCTTLGQGVASSRWSLGARRESQRPSAVAETFHGLYSYPVSATHYTFQPSFFDQTASAKSWKVHRSSMMTRLHYTLPVWSSHLWKTWVVQNVRGRRRAFFANHPCWYTTEMLLVPCFSCAWTLIRLEGQSSVWQ